MNPLPTSNSARCGGTELAPATFGRRSLLSECGRVPRRFPHVPLPNQSTTADCRLIARNSKSSTNSTNSPYPLPRRWRLRTAAWRRGPAVPKCKFASWETEAVTAQITGLHRYRNSKTAYKSAPVVQQIRQIRQISHTPEAAVEVLMAAGEFGRALPSRIAQEPNSALGRRKPRRMHHTLRSWLLAPGSRPVAVELSQTLSLSKDW
jgi:hypothetical protein